MAPRHLRQHGLVAFGDVLCTSEGVLIERQNPDPASAKARDQLIARVQGVVFAQQFVMLDYNCQRDLLAEAAKLTPGKESPTVSDLAEPGWVAVRAMVPRKGMNGVMDELSEIGARAILASDIRACRM